MHTEYPLIEILDDEYRSFCLDHGLDDERIANARLLPGVRRWLRDYEARLAAARVLAPLAARALAAEYDTEEHEAAHNAFADAIAPYMTNAQRQEWDGWCLKATDVEQIDEAFRILGLPSPRKLEEANKTPAPPSVADYFEQKLAGEPRAKPQTRWTYSIDDIDGNGEASTTFTCTDLLETKAAAYYRMCAVFDGPLPEVEEKDKQYVPPADWEQQGEMYVWDVYSDGTFVVRVFPAGQRDLPTPKGSWL